MKTRKKLGPCLLSFLIFFTITSFLLPYIFASDDDDDDVTSNSRLGAPPHLSLSSLLRRVSTNLENDWKKARRDVKLHPTDVAASVLSFRAAFVQTLDEKQEEGEEDDDEERDMKEEEEIVSMLLGALMSERNDVDVSSMLDRSRPLVRPYFFTSSVGKTLIQSQRLKRSSSYQKHEISALFVLASCRVFEESSRRFGSGLRDDMILATEGLISRVTNEGLLDLHHKDDQSNVDDTNNQERLYSTLRQGESLAALRCSGAKLNHKEYFETAERLRRGLFLFYSAVENNSGDPDYSNFKSPFATSTLIDKNGNAHQNRELTTQLPMLLLFLEHRDVPAQVIQEIAETSTALLTPVGLQEESMESSDLNKKSIIMTSLPHEKRAWSWRVSPIEQAMSFAGIVKHMLPLSGRLNAGGNSIGDEAGAGDLLSADALSALIDGVLRVEQALMQLEEESASRMSDKVRQTMSVFYKDLKDEPLGGIIDHRIKSLLRSTAKFQKRLGDSAAAAVLGKLQRSISKRAGNNPKSWSSSENAHLALPSLPPAVSLLLNATSLLIDDDDYYNVFFTFPQFLTPLHSSDRPISPRLVADAASSFSWPELRDGESAQGKQIRAELSDRLAAAGEASLAAIVREASTAAVSTANTTTPPLTALAPLIEEIANGMKYPPTGGLLVVRTRDSETEETIIPEQVVVEVLRHQHSAAALADDENGNGKSDGSNSDSIDDSSIDASSPQRLVKKDSVKHSNTVLVRGNGRPFHSSTAVAAVFFRRLFENAYTWLKGRDALVVAEEKMKKVKNDAPIKLWINEEDAGSKSKSPQISSSAMQAYLHSGAADASLLAVDFEWLKDPLLSKYRNIRGGEERSMLNKTHSEPFENIGRNKEESETQPRVEQIDENVYMKRLCADSSGDRSKSAWYKSCCVDAVAAATFASTTFQCLSVTSGQEFFLTLPCRFAEDDFCDCLVDGTDEVTTSACSMIEDKSRREPNLGFLCASGVKSDPPRGILVNGGQPNYISYKKVKDGVADCNNGEDES